MKIHDNGDVTFTRNETTIILLAVNSFAGRADAGALSVIEDNAAAIYPALPIALAKQGYDRHMVDAIQEFGLKQDPASLGVFGESV